MPGPPKPGALGVPMTVALEDLDLGGHLHRHLKPKLDLGVVRLWSHELDGERVRPSVDPVVFKLQLVMFSKGIRSKRQRIEEVRLTPALETYLGHTVASTRPGRSNTASCSQ